MMRTKRTLNRFLLITVVCLFGCGRQVAPKVDIVNTDKKPLETYAYDARDYDDTDADSYPLRASLDEMFHFVEAVCTQVEGGQRWIDEGSGGCTMPDDYISYRVWTCIGDLLKKIADSPKPFAIKRQHHPVGINTVVDIENFASELNDFGAIPDTIVFAPLNTIDKREAIIHLSLNAYLQAIHYITLFIPDDGDPSGTTLRDEAYSSVGDYWYDDFEASDESGYSLVDKMFASLTSIIRTIKEIKFSLAEGKLRQGVKQNSQWTDEDYGRIPAIRHLFGNTDDRDLDGICDDDEGTGAYMESNGQVVVEAEHFKVAFANGSGDNWIVVSDGAASGGFTMQVVPDDGDVWISNIEQTAPYLSLKAYFAEAGTYTIWIRGKSTAQNGYASNSVHAGIDGTCPAGAQNIDFPENGTYAWSSGVIAVPSTGIHTINLFGQKDGFFCDKLVLDKNGFVPTGLGPEESQRDEGTGSDSADDSCGSDTENEYPLSTAIQITTNEADQYCAEFVVYNTGDETTSSWTVTMDVGEAQIYNSWNAEYTQTGAIARFDSLNHNGTLVPGASEGFGLCAHKTENTTVFPVVTTSFGSLDALPTSGIVGAIVLQSDGVDNYCANVMVHNYGTEPTSSWEIKIDLKQSQVTNLWNADYTVDADNIMTATSKSYNQVILPGDVTSFGFCAQKTGPDYVAIIYTEDNECNSSEDKDYDGAKCVPVLKIIPETIIGVPILNDSISNAIHLIATYIDDPAPFFVPEPDLNQLTELLLENANQDRGEIGLAGYDDLEDLLFEHKTDTASIAKAVEYMTAHMMLFPRLPSFVTDDNTGQIDAVVRWENKYLRAPWHYYLRNLHRMDIGTLSGVEENSEEGGLFSLPKEVGLLSILNYLEWKLLSMSERFATMDNWSGSTCNDSDESEVLDVEQRVETRLKGAINEIQRYLGKNKDNRLVRYTYEKNDVGNADILFEVINAAQEETAPGVFDVYDRLRLIPVNEADGIEKLNLYTCAHIGGGVSREGCDALLTGIIEAPSAASCSIAHSEAVAPEVSCEFFVGDIPLEDSWIVELKTIAPGDDASGAWRAIGAITSALPRGEDRRSDIMVLNGNLANIGERTLDIDDVDLKDATDMELSSFEAYSEKVDRDWVPAIENETIDHLGITYEDSYKHYLALARIAAREAQKTRDEIIDDVVRENRETTLVESTRDGLSDDYFSNIHEICGEDVSVSESDFRSVVEHAEDPEAVRRTLLESYWGVGADQGDDKKLYGCKNGVSNVGPIQCAVKRNCTPVDVTDGDRRTTVLGDLIDVGDDDNGVASQLLGVVEDDCVFYEEDLLSSLDVEIPPLDENFYENVRTALRKKRCAIVNDKINKIGLFKNIPIEAWPEGERGSTSGAYANKLAGIDMTLLDIQSALKSYINAIDRSANAIDLLIAMVDVIESQSDFEVGAVQAATAIRMLNVALEESYYNDSYDRGWKSCLLRARAKYRSVDVDDEIVGQLLGTQEDVVDMLRELNGAFGRDNRFAQNRKDNLKYFEDGENFLSECKKAAAYLNSPVLTGDLRYIPRMCEEIYRREWRSKSDRVLEYENKLTNESCCQKEAELNYLFRSVEADNFHEHGYTDFAYTMAKPGDYFLSPLAINQMKIHVQCRNINKMILGEDNKFHWFVCAYRDAFEDYYDYNCESSPGYGASPFSPCEDSSIYFQLDREYLPIIANYVIDEIEKIDIEKCELQFGCKEDDAYCMGPAGKSYTAVQDKIEDIGAKLEAMNKRVETSVIVDYVERLRQMLASISNNWIQARHAISSRINTLQSQINALSSLEQRQVDLFDSFVNGLNTADAVSYSSLNEWTERYNQREKRYREQLRRARIAAWTAQRAIEFRFGIDLSNEHDMTIYGDVPSIWVNKTLFEDYASTCGVEPNPSETGDSALTGCFSDTDRIEDYIQKLDDFVESYGNSPGQNWWFHEDDDIAVISLKSYYNLQDPLPSVQTVNHLYFTEEIDMTPEMTADTYGALLDRLTPQKRPVAWSSTGFGAVVSDRGIAEVLGVPQDVVNANNNTERYVFADREERNTAELLTDTRNLETIRYDTGERSGIVQTIDLEAAGIESDESDKLDFSVYLKKAPETEACDVAAGEIFFPDIGQCGIVCDPNEISSEGTADGCAPGQVCVPAGDLLKPLATVEEPVYMCDWCAADGACIGQAGDAVQLSIEVLDGDATLVASKNVGTGWWWQRARVSTLSDSTEDTPSVSINGAASVYISGTETRNLVASSETFDETRGWQMSGDTVSMLTTQIDAPNNAGIAPVFAMRSEKDSDGNVSSDSVSISAADAVVDRNQYTGSVWVRVGGNDSEMVPMTLVLETEAGVLFGIKSFEKTPDVWSRVKVGGTLRSAASHIRMTLYPSGKNLIEGASASYTVAVWGAQIEWGTAATPYIPTGKNLLANSTMLDTAAWSLDGSTISTIPMSLDRNRVIRAPDQRQGEVAALFGRHSDVTPGFTDRLTQTVDIDDLSDRYVFSVWMRGETYTEHKAMISVDSPAFVAPVSATVSVGSDWNRYAIAVSPDDVNSDDVGQPSVIEVAISPMVEAGSRMLYVWGPQLEEGVYASGYEKKDASLAVGQRVWPLDAGVVGTQLSLANTYYCDELGQKVVLDEGCESNCTDGLYVCAGTVDDYVRNTYMKEHYPSGYRLENTVDAPYPLLHEIRAHMPDHIEAQNFREKLCDSPDLDGNSADVHSCHFDVNVERIQHLVGDDLRTIAPDNFNYRIETIAVNLVGTKVIDCKDAASEADCESNRWVKFDLRHSGDAISIQNHHKENPIANFMIQPGYIHGGKAWASEQTVAYPISSEQSSMIRQLQSIAMMGRPLDGGFDLVFYTDRDEISWRNVEDIQLILGYHYWSSSN